MVQNGRVIALRVSELLRESRQGVSNYTLQSFFPHLIQIRVEIDHFTKINLSENFGTQDKTKNCNSLEYLHRPKFLGLGNINDKGKPCFDQIMQRARALLLSYTSVKLYFIQFFLKL